MASNTVTLIGNLVDDPELRFTPSGVAMAKVRFAVNRRYQRQGEWQEETSFFTGTCWREMAEHAFCGGRAADIAGADEQDSDHDLPVCGFRRLV